MNKEMTKAEQDIKKAEIKAALAPIFKVAEKVYDRLPETPKTMAESVATGALIGNFIPIPGVGAGIGALVGGAIGWWRIKNR